MEVQSSIERVEASLSEIARERLLSLPGEPLFIADWKRTLMIHYEPQFCECERGSLTEWLVERYAAFTKLGNIRRFFRVWHQPWLQTPAEVSVIEQSLLNRNWPLFRNAQIIGANFSPGLTDVWMGWPHRVSA